MKISILSLLFISLFIGHLSGQQFIVKETTEILKSKYGVGKFLKTQNDNYISFAWEGEADISLGLYDSSLNKLPATLKAHFMKNIGSHPFYIGNKLAVFAYDYNRKVDLWRTDEQLTNPLTMQELFKASARDATFLSGYSADSSYYYIVARSEEGRNKPILFEGVVLDNKLNVTCRINLATSAARKDVGGVNYLLTTHGKFYIFYSATNKNELLMQDASGSSTTTLNGLPVGIADYCALIEKNNRAYFCSILASGRDKVQTGIQAGIIDLQSKTVQLTTDVSASRSIIPGVYEIMEQTPLAQLPYPDGSYICVFEEDEKYGGSYYYNANPALSTSYVQGYLRKDLYIVKFSPEWKVEWYRRVTKRQDQTGVSIYLSVACMQDNKGGVHLLLQDDRANTQVETEKPEHYNYTRVGTRTLTSINITRDGKISKQFISDNKGKDFIFAPRLATSFRPNEILYIAVDYSYVTGRYKYRPEIIKLKD